MTAHYHGTPIGSGDEVMEQLAGRFFCVSHRNHGPRDLVAVAHRFGRGVLLDNGAFAAWTRKRSVDWRRYYAWAAPWLDHPTTWAIVPDVIDGDERANDDLIEQWPHGVRGAPVWHMHESIARLCRLADRWPRVCVGSSGDYRVIGTPRWHGRMVAAMNELCGDGPPPVALHMLRGMTLAGSHYPFASVDSTDIARNHSRKIRTAASMARRWESQHCPTTWKRRPVQQAFAEFSANE